jgi:GDP/UDP-N,N'-diacetylbacillosamine 2-epimerase (hydrolysing)
MTRSICVVTGTRAEYGLLEPLISRIASDRSLTLELIVTGTHVSPEFGMTVKAIENDGYSIARKIEMLVSSDSDVGVAKSVGLGIIGFADALQELQPDVLVVLGDRFEMLAITSTAMLMHIPILHIHGGELTAGALDDSIRHAITKMANVHCVATDEYRRRVVQLGEHCNSVFCVGGLGVDAIKKTNLLTKKELEGRLGFVFKDRNLLVSLHPETMIKGVFEHQIAELFAALASKPDIGLIFSLSNADAGGRAITKKIKEFVRTNPSAITIPSLGQQFYLSCINECDGLIGNSSSGFLEAHLFVKDR